MDMSKSPQENWHQIRHILQKYLLNTSVPLIFKDLISRPYLLKNAGYNQFITDRKIDHCVYESWEILLKAALTDIFIHRLLGSQADMHVYWRRSEKYREVFNDIFGVLNMDSDLQTLTKSFFGMLKDYLCRNMNGMPANCETLPVRDVLEQCRKIYHMHSLRNDKEEDINRIHYIAFEEQTYASSLLTLLDEIAENMEGHPKTRYYLVAAEYIHTLFIYVYMVEFVKLYPSIKGLSFKDNDVMRHEREYNLFKELGKMDFMSVYHIVFAKMKKKQKERKQQQTDNDIRQIEK